MSKVYSTVNGFVGFNGQSHWLGEGDEYDSSDAIVKALPEGTFVARPSISALVAEEKASRRRTTRE